jgi:hypothetical protein
MRDNVIVVRMARFVDESAFGDPVWSDGYQVKVDRAVLEHRCASDAAGQIAVVRRARFASCRQKTDERGYENHLCLPTHRRSERLGLERRLLRSN